MEDQSKTKAELIGELKALRARVSRLKETRQERKEVGEKLREEHSFAGAIIERAGDGVCVCHDTPEPPYVRFTVWNHRMAEITGYTLEEINELGWYQSVYPDEELQARAVERMGRMRRGDDLVAEEWEITRKDGEKRFVSMSTSVLEGEGDEVHVLALMQDVTDRKRAEEFLRESEERYRSLFKNNHSVMLLIDPESANIVDANPAACSFYGWDLSEFTEKKITEINTLAEEEVFEEIRRVEAESRKHFFFRHRLKSGEIRDVEVYSGPIVLHGKRLLYSIVHDVTDRKRAEEALAESEKKYRAFFKTTRDVAFITSKDGRWMDMSDSAPEFFGYENREELQEVRIPDLYEDPGERLHHTQKIVRDGYTMEYPVNLRKKDGSVMNTLITSVSIKDEHGEVTGFQGTIRDITDRKRAEEALKESEANYRMLVESLPAVVFRGYPDFSVDFFDEKVLELTGYPKEEFDSGRLRWSDIIVDEDLEEMKEVLMAAHRGTGSYVREYRIRRRDGDIRWVQGRGQVVRDEAGGIAYVSGVLFDITERRIAEEALRREKEKFRVMVEEAPLGISIIGRDGTYEYANSKFMEMFGYTIEEVPSGRAWFEKAYPVPEYRKKVISTWKSDLKEYKEGEARPRTFTVRCKDGTDKIIHFRPVTMTGGQQLIIYEDITERQKAQEALKESEEKFRELAELLPETIFEMDLDGTLAYANRNAFEHFKYTQEDFDSGLNCFDMIAPEDRERARESVSKILNGEALGLMEYRALRKDGTTFPALLRSSPIIRGGNPVGLRGFMIDITRTKRLESQLLNAQKMEALGTLAGGIAHDFNNILGAIIGNTEMALLDLDNKAHLTESLEQVLGAGRRATELVRQILAIGRRSEPGKKPARLGLILKEALRMLRATLPAVIEIRREFDAPRDYILADPTQVHQVVMNLCTNAAHAMRDSGGVLHLGLENVTLPPGAEVGGQDLSPGDYVKLTVRDTGRGMDGSVLERIFDPYFTTKEKGEGTGLGLAVVESIVKGHRGAITVKSELGEGTEFTVFLPVTQVDDAGEEDSAGAVPGGDERILFVDDERALVKMARKILSRLGYEVTATTSSLEALELFRADPHGFDLVITDMTMPRMTGADLAGELLRLRPDIPVVLCTGFSEAVSREQAEALGVREYVMKPIHTRQMAATVRRVLDAAAES